MCTSPRFGALGYAGCVLRSQRGRIGINRKEEGAIGFRCQRIAHHARSAKLGLHLPVRIGMPVCLCCRFQVRQAGHLGPTPAAGAALELAQNV